MQDSNKNATHDFLAGGGEMGRVIREKDWASTPLGPIERWPQSLRSALSICLGSRFPIWIGWGPDLVKFYNDAFRPILGQNKHPRALGRSVRECWAEIWDVIGPMIDQSVMQRGESTWSDDQLLIMDRNGYPEETYFTFSYSPIREEGGGIGGMFCAVTETTGRVVGERRLALLKDLAERSAAARCAREACALSIEALAAKPQDVPFAAAYLGEELQASTPSAQPELTRELPLGGAGRLVVGINPQRPFDDQYAAFLDLLAGQIATALANATAYEQERKRAEALAELDRAKTAFFSNVSHEFRTPLTLMLGPVEDGLADAASPLPPAQRERMELARRSALRLQKLVNALLDFSRIEAGRAQASYEATDLAALTGELASSFRSAMEKAGLAFDVDCAPLSAPAWVDRDMWEKIVLNLLSNAFKFTFEGGVSVSLCETGQDIVLEIKDTGTGIPAAELPHVFERFRRVEGARSRTYEGTGIGLALVQELARLHGGAVSVESEEGRGSSFRVTIPAGSAHLPAERIGAGRTLASTSVGAESFVEEALRWLPSRESAPERAVAAQFDGKPRIVWADDNADMREYVRSLLAPYYEVEAVADGEEALAAVRARRPELVLTDVMMPRVDGLELLRRLRADPQTSTLPVLVLSARAGEESRVEGLGAGADDYLYKPFTARELLARVGALARAAELRSRAERKVRESEQRLREADRRKDEFLATLAHELRNPLAPLKNALQLLRQPRADEVSGEGLHGMMERQVDHLVRLVDDLLEMSRISRGAFELRSERVAVAAVLQNAIETSRPLIEAAHHHFAVHYPETALWLDGDPVRLAQILSNLLNNAAKYTDPGGSITLSARREGEEAVISVRDNGIGIAPAALVRVFDMFNREERTRRRGQEGLGIGLALARRLAEMHGGRLEGESEGPGRGALFTLWLPLAAAPAPAPDARRAQLEAPLRQRILVVDDNTDAAESLGMLLQTLGAEVHIAHDGRGALASFAAHDPQVVLLDIGMPGMDGYEVARSIRARYPERGATLVALTGWGQDEDRRRAEHAGFDHHLVKPAELGELHALFASLELRRTAQARP